MSNLPPFYVGQKVVALKTMKFILKDNTYTVANCFQCKKCKEWHVLLSEFIEKSNAHYTCYCGDTFDNLQNAGAGAKRFAPIEEKFQSISFKEVIKIESPLIGIN